MAMLLNDGIGYVRQGADEQGQVMSSWLFDPDGTVLEEPEGLVSHLICGGVYDWSTGLIFKGGRYSVLRTRSPNGKRPPPKKRPFILSVVAPIR